MLSVPHLSGGGGRVGNSTFPTFFYKRNNFNGFKSEATGSKPLHTLHTGICYNNVHACHTDHWLRKIHSRYSRNSEANLEGIFNVVAPNLQLHYIVLPVLNW